MEEKERRYKIKKIEKLDEKINDKEKLQVLQIFGAMVCAYTSYLMFGGYADTEYLTIVRRVFGVMGTIFAATSLYHASGILESILEKAALKKERFDLECDLKYAEKEEEPKVLRK